MTFRANRQIVRASVSFHVVSVTNKDYTAEETLPTAYIEPEAPINVESLYSFERHILYAFTAVVKLYIQDKGHSVLLLSKILTCEVFGKTARIMHPRSREIIA